MKLEEFEDLLDRFGEDLTVWPASARKAGRELLRNSGDARRIMQEARALRQAMAAAEPVRAPAGLADRIVAEAMHARPVARPVTRAPLRRAMAWLKQVAVPLRPSIVLPMSFLAGVIVGLNHWVFQSTIVLVDVPLMLTGMLE
jgi:hypothetical protein